MDGRDSLPDPDPGEGQNRNESSGARLQYEADAQHLRDQIAEEAVTA